MKTYEDILEYYKIKNELIDNSFLNSTKEKFLDLKKYKTKDEAEEELLLMRDMIDFYKYDDGLELEGIKNIENVMSTLDLLGSYLEILNLFYLKQNIELYRKSKNRAKNVRDKYKRI